MRRLLLIFALLAGCDRGGGSQPPPRPEGEKPTPAVEITSVTPLLPRRPTHVAATERGQVFWVQESEAGRETVFAISEGGLPATTKFGTTTVLEALKEPSAKGNIQSLAAGRDGRIYFYFSGGKGRKMLAAFGEFVPTTGETHVLLDTAGLARESEMGNALALARGTVVRAGNLIWLWLRHDEGYAFLSLDETRVGATVRRPFARVRSAGGTPPSLTSARPDLSPGAANGLTYLDRRDGRVWRIDSLGEASVAQDWSDLPKEVTAPTPDEFGRLVAFAPEGPRFSEKPEALEGLGLSTRPAGQRIEYPAVVIVDGGRRQVLGRGTLSAPATTDLRSLAVPTWIRDRSSFVAYEPRTGELLRVRVVER